VTQVETVSLIELMQDPEVRADPYPTYARLQAMGPVLPTLFGGWLLTRHAEVFSVLRDARFSSNSRHNVGYEQFVELARQLDLSDLQDLFGRVMIFADPPDHTRLRRIVGKAFTLRAVEDMRPRIAATVDRLLDGVAVDGGADLVEALAFPLPVTVISDMLGVPDEDHEMLRAWTAEAVKALDPSDDMTVFFPAAEAIRAMRSYFDELVGRRQGAPGPDLLSALIAAEDQGDRLSHEELLDTAILLFGARHVSFGGGIHHCLGAPLARIEAQEALGHLIRRFPDLALDERDIEWKPTSTIRGPQHLALVW
jgi:cytochrome P450